MTTPHDAYIATYKRCQRARDDGISHIAIGRWGGGDYFLIATNDPGKKDACCYQAITGVWAENILYRLADLGHIEGGRDALDAYFDAF